MIPLIAPLIHLVGPPLIKGLITGVEKLFGAKTGPDKMAAVIAALRPIVDKLSAAGKLPGVAEDSVLQTVIETIFQGMKDTGELDTVGVNKIPAGHQVIIIPPGAKIVTIEFGETPNGIPVK